MCSATDFLPSYIRQFINLVKTASPNFASGRTSRLTAARRRDMPCLLFRPLGAVFGTPLPTILDALGVERPANDMIAHSGQILDPSAADQHHRVLLQIMSFPRDITRHLEAVGQPYARDLAQRRIRLFWRGRIDAGAHAALLRAGLHCRNLVARHLRPPRISDQLVYRRHSNAPLLNTLTARRGCAPGR